jgi:hypothetical protein
MGSTHDIWAALPRYPGELGDKPVVYRVVPATAMVGPGMRSQ